MKFTKKITSVFMAIAMVITMLPLGALTSFADNERDNYLFSYFTGNAYEQQRIRFALSEDGTSYNAINKNDPVINQTQGTLCARDPYIFRGQDGKYYAIATDADCSTNVWWGNSNSFVIWRSTDLVTWTDETIIDVSAITGVDVYRAWAPQVIWDSSANKYMVYFGLAANGYSGGETKMHYMYTTDLLDQSKYEAPQPLMKNNSATGRANDSIDADITYYNGTYYMFYKNEGNATICIITSDTLTGPYDTDNIVTLNAGSDIGGLEGCQVWWNEDSQQYVFMADRYGANNGAGGIFACYNIGDNLDTFYNAVSSNPDISGYYNADMSNKISVLSPRHGSIINITSAEYNRLVNAYGIASNEDIRYNFNSADKVYSGSWQYFTAEADTSGYSYDVMCHNSGTGYIYKDEHYISLKGGANVFINDPAVKALMADNKWTVSFDVSVSEANGSPIFALCSGDSPASSIDWIRLLDNGEVYLYKNGGYVKIGQTGMLSSVEYTFTIVYNGTTIYFYKDGKQFASDAIGEIHYDKTKGTSPIAFGWTDTCGANGVVGSYANVRFRNKALTSSQVASETAIGSELLYRYNEGTSELDGRINATNTGSGIKTSMSGGRGASYTVAGWVNIGASKQDNSALFEFGNGGTNDYKQYFTLRENGILHYCWADGSTHHYFDSESVFNFSSNTWYYVQVNIVPDGNSCHFRVFVDGNSVYDKPTTYGAMTTFAYNPHNFFMQSSIPVKFGKGEAHWTDTASSYIDDFRVYTKAIDPAVLYQKQQQEDRAEQAGASGAETGANLDEAMGIFESRIAQMASSGYSVMYANISPAYEAYKKAVVANGTGSLAEEAVLAEFNEALTNMTPFTEFTGTANPSGENFSVSNTAGQIYYRNVIYSEAANGAHAFGDYSHRKMEESYGLLWTYGTHAYIYYPQAVLLYDGKNTPVLPVVAGFKNSDNRYSLNMLSLYEEMEDFGLLQSWWYGFTGETSLKWPTQNDQIIPTDPSNTSENQYAETPESNDGNYKIVKNGFEYTATPTSAYTCYSSTTWGMVGQYTYLAGDHQVNGSITNAVPDIDIINYKKLIDALKAAANNSTNKGYLADLQEKYQSGGLEGIFAAYDSATTLDPNTGSTYFNHTYDYNAFGIEEAMDKAALLCGEDIDASVVLLSDIKITTETANYNRLVAAIEAYEAKMASMNKLHTNLEAAYKAYLVAIEYKDAYEYGARESFENPTLAGAAEALENATERMVSVDSMTWDGKAIYGGNDSPNGYSNVVYSDSGANVWSDTINQSYTNWRITTSRNTVLIYDGAAANNVYLPAILSTQRESSHVNRLAGASASNSLFELREVWRGYLSGATGEANYKFADPTDDNYDNNSDYGGSRTNSEHTLNYVTGDYNSIVNGKHPNTTARYWYNRLYYKGSGDTTNYYEKTTSFSFGVSGVHEMVWDREGTNTNGSFSTNTYVINYKPLRDKLMAIAFNGVDVTNYQEGGLVEFFQKIDEITKVDPNAYDAVEHPNGYAYSSNTETAVQACANDIKKALNNTDNMPTLPDCPVDVNTKGDVYDGETLKPIDTENNGAYTNLKIALEEVKNAPTEQGCIVNRTWNDYQAKIEAAQTAMYTIANNTNIDANTGKDGYAYNGGAYTSAEINTLATDLDAAINALYDLANSEHPLKFSYEEEGTHDGYFQCYSNNSHIVEYDEDTHETSTLAFADMAVYDELGIVYSTIDLTKYESPEGLKAAKTVYNQVKTVPGAPGEGAQDIVDGGITALLEGINDADEYEGADNVNTYNVTFEVYKNDTRVATSTKSYDYGTAITLDAASAYAELGDKVCTDWVVDSTRIVNRSNTFNLYVQRDVTVKAYFVELDPSVENAAEIRLATVTNYTMYQIAGTTASTITIQSGENLNTIKVDGNDYTVPNTVVYNITGWKVGNHELTAGNYTVADLMQYCYSPFLKIDPIIEAKHSSETETYTVSLDGTELFTNVQYDTRKSVTSNVDNFYAIVVHDGNKFIPISYSNTYDFYVIYDMEMYTMIKDGNEYKVTMGNNTTTITDETMLFYLNHKLPFVYSFVSPDKDGKISEGIYNKQVLNAAFTTDCDIEVTECGILFSTASINISDMTVDNVDSVATLYKRVNTKRDEKSNQYYYALKSTSHTGPVQLRGYVKYKYTYHDPINDEDVTIDAVAYSDVNTAYYNMADPNAQ